MELYFFYKPDCAPCAAQKPVIEALAAETGVPVRWLNAETNLTAVGVYRVKAVPTVVVVDQQGGRVAGFFGAMIDPVRIRRFLGV